MKFYCLGYYDVEKWDAMSESERNDLIDECFAYDDVLRRNGHVAGGDGLQGPQDTRTIKWKNGKAVTSTGPYAKTKEQLGGILVLEARDLDHAIQLISRTTRASETDRSRSARWRICQSSWRRARGG